MLDCVVVPKTVCTVDRCGGVNEPFIAYPLGFGPDTSPGEKCERHGGGRDEDRVNSVHSFGSLSARRSRAVAMRESWAGIDIAA
jgi:hypothetical protein